jgi:RNA polymerase sigma factor (sigma-70 family)
MKELFEPTDPWESFKQGRSVAFLHYFNLHNSRIYYYLLRLLRDQAQAREVTRHAFVLIFRKYTEIEDEEHLLRRLYLNAKVGYLLRLKGKRSIPELEKEVENYAQKDETIMDDPDVARNETLLALEDIVQQLPQMKREVAELYFFQAFPTSAIAQLLGLEERNVRSIISEILQRVGEQLGSDDHFFPVQFEMNVLSLQAF